MDAGVSRTLRGMRRTQRFLMIFVLVQSCLLIVAFAANDQPRDLVVSSLTVVAGGHTVAALKPRGGEKPSGRLEIYGPGGRVALIAHGPEGLGSISLWDTRAQDRNPETRKPMLSLGCTGPGGAQIFMKNERGQRAINLVAQGRGQIRLWDGSGTQTAHLP